MSYNIDKHWLFRIHGSSDGFFCVQAEDHDENVKHCASFYNFDAAKRYIAENAPKKARAPHLPVFLPGAGPMFSAWRAQS